jgi:hypothetical protein
MIINSTFPSAAAGYVIECHGVGIRAQLRSVATVVHVTGRINARNRGLVATHLRRFTRLDSPLVLDLLDCRGFGPELLDDMLRTIENDCGGADLTLVINPLLGDARVLSAGVEIVGSVAEALGIIVAQTKQRRAAALLPAVGGSLRPVEAISPENAQATKRGVHETNEAV